MAGDAKKAMACRHRPQRLGLYPRLAGPANPDNIVNANRSHSCYGPGYHEFSMEYCRYAPIVCT